MEYWCDKKEICENVQYLLYLLYFFLIVQYIILFFVFCMILGKILFTYNEDLQ